MTIATDRVQELFQDARFLQVAAVDRLNRGDIRDAARFAAEGGAAGPPPTSPASCAPE